MCINMMDLSIIKPVIFFWKKVSVSIEKKCKNNLHKMCACNCNEGWRNSYVDIMITAATFFLLWSRIGTLCKNKLHKLNSEKVI